MFLSKFLLAAYDVKNKCNGLAKGAINAAADKFKVHRSTISHLWRRACLSCDKGELPADIRSKKLVRVQPKRLDKAGIKENHLDIFLYIFIL